MSHADGTPPPSKRSAYEPAARLLKPTGYDPDMPRPTATVAGAVLVLLRVIAGIFVLVGLAAGWNDLMTDSDVVLEGVDPSSDVARLGLWIVLAVGSVVLLADLLLAVLIYRGLNWARVLVMLISVMSISTSFIAWWVQGQEITLDSTFLSLSLDILVLLALSSRSAAAYARRSERE